jgi:large subunit ribosomal protein L24
MVKNIKLKIKRGDKVKIIAGSYIGKEGKVIEVLRKKMRIIVEGVALYKRHQKPNQNNSEGGIVEREGSIHYSNVKLIDTKK